MTKSGFYHAGCPVCISTEQDIVNLIGADNSVKTATVLQKPKTQVSGPFLRWSPRTGMCCISTLAFR